jgi:hypothetical protein
MKNQEFLWLYLSQLFETHGVNNVPIHVIAAIMRHLYDPKLKEIK